MYSFGILSQFFIINSFYNAYGDSFKVMCKFLNRNFLFLFFIQKLGLLSLIDEESRFPKGTDKSLLTKLHENHAVCISQMIISN